MTDPAAAAPQRRDHLTRFLVGAGIEIGPGHHPLPLPYPGAIVRYVDRWSPAENRRLFGELGEADFPEPDVIANLDVDRLSALPDASEDFVIASHVLEHLAEPLGMIAEIHRVLRPGGVALVLLPDRRHTFDAGRPPTTVDHLVAEHEARVTVVDDAHVEEFLRATSEYDSTWDDESRAAAFDLHRRRSIHVHCWAEDEFVAVLEHTITSMDMRWELLDAVFVSDVAGGFEFGVVLRRSTVELAPAVAATRLRESWSSLADDSRRDRDRLASGAAAEATLRRIRRLPGYGLARGAYGRARRWSARRTEERAG